MKFKNMAEYMGREDIETVLGFFYPYGSIIKMERIMDRNFIEVYFSNNYSKEPLKVDFLSDDVYIYENSTMPDGEPCQDEEKMHKYKQYMVAKGYSDVWLNNPYCT